MPVRTKAINNLSDSIGDYDLAEEAYLNLVASIDWKRVKLEATGRCLELHDGLPYEDLGCGDCIEAVLLATKTFPTWEEA